ncbi:MAG: hypothetical protein HY698_20185 [Deltaproteobacteria bacterium]|nr:hypothetical protein [Deltaproteobacteria bacterium]
MKVVFISDTQQPNKEKGAMHEPTPPWFPCTISQCPNGCICLQFGMAMIHLPRGEFASFVAKAVEALQSIEGHKPAVEMCN